jgi:hypothetical protein
MQVPQEDRRYKEDIEDEDKDLFLTGGLPRGAESHFVLSPFVL